MFQSFVTRSPKATVLRRSANMLCRMERSRTNLISDETGLLERSRSNDRSAQEQLYARTVDRVYGLLKRMTRNEADALDLVQETYMKAFTRLDQFDGRSAFATWLYRLAVNEALQFLKRAQRHEAHARKNHRVSPESNDSQHHDAAMDIEAALASLDHDDQALLLLRYQEGLDYRAIADALECSMGTVASRLNRARDKLRQILKKGYGPTEETAPVAHLISDRPVVPGRQGSQVGPADR